MSGNQLQQTDSTISETEAKKQNVSVAPPPVLPNATTNSDEPTSYPSFLTEPNLNQNDSEDVVSASAPIIPVIPSETLQESEEIAPQKTDVTEDTDTPSEEKEAFESDEFSPQSAPVIPVQPDQPTEIGASSLEPSENSSEIETSEQNFSESEKETQSSESEKSVENFDTPADTSPKETLIDYKSEDFLPDLFANNNECITTVNGSFPVKDDTRTLLALFSNGRFFVAEAARFDGKVLGFEYLARKRRFQIGKPEYVPSIVISDIYKYAAQNIKQSFIPKAEETDSQEQVRMQRDFVTIISRAAMQRVSDVHIVVADHTTVMFRINGLMQTEMEYNKEWGESFVRAAFASADISDANYAQNEYQAAQKLGRTPLRGSSGQLLLPRNILGIRLQFNPIAFGSRYVVMRLLYAEDNSANAYSLAALGFTQREMDLFYQMRSIPTGIIIISGPTGSGKSTTLQRNMIAMLQERNYELNLITVEDPPEYPIPGARQMPVTNAMIEEAKDREFTKALSAALRSDPDTLMIGEIRTLAAADLAFRGALSGHSVWTTLHTNSAPAILMRLKDIGVEDFKLQDPSIMRALMAQRLFRKLCPHCRIKATSSLDNPAVQRLRKAFGDVALEKCYLRGPGCEECDMRGVNGRTVISEFLLPDATFLDLSVRGEFSKAMNYWINDLGGVTLRESAINRMLSGIVDIEEVERWTGLLDQPVLA